LRGGRINALLKADEVDAERVELTEGIYERMCGASKAVVPPNQHNIHRAAANSFTKSLVTRPIVSSAGRTVYALFCQLEPAARRILVKRLQLRLGVLRFVECGNSRIECRSQNRLLFVHKGNLL